MAKSGENQIALTGGFYEARSPIGNFQRCVNLYPEKNPEDSPAPYTMYPTPGLTLLAAGPIQAIYRGLYTATNGQVFAVIGVNVYYIDYAAGYKYTQIGTLQTPRNNPVSFVDNGQTIFLVDGSTSGYTIDLTTHVFVQLNNPNFFGGTRADILDGFALFNQIATRNFYTSLDFSTAFDPLYVAAKSGYPDPLSTLIVMHREIWLFGSLFTTEIWNNVGNANFPFAIIPGVFIEHGCAAPYSVAKHDLQVFWLSKDKDGQATVFMGQNYAAKRISTPAIAAKFSKYSVISDAIGMTYKQQDHVFYMLTFPTADATWVFDVTEGLWHERAFNDVNGKSHRHRANCMTFANGQNLVGDFQNGNLYAFDLEAFTDNGAPIIRRRGFPHLINDGNWNAFSAFAADLSTGASMSPSELQALSPFSMEFSPEFGPVTNLEPDQIYLVWSDTRGRTWGNPVGQPIGATGDYLLQPQWRNLGGARDRVFELFWAAPIDAALQGAWIDVTKGTH